MTVSKAIFTKPQPAWQHFSGKKDNSYNEYHENLKTFSRRYEATKMEEKQTDGRTLLPHKVSFLYFMKNVRNLLQSRK
jgi:hypothetical protein